MTCATRTAHDGGVGNARGTIAAMPEKAAKKSTSRSRKRNGSGDVQLTADRIVVRHPDDGERTSRGGLLIPATAAPAPRRLIWSEVTLVGPDVRGVRSGDRVLFLPQSGLEVELDGHDFLLLRERDVQAVESPPADAGERQPGQYL
jgi:chaperonin GroES